MRIEAALREAAGDSRPGADGSPMAGDAWPGAEGNPLTRTPWSLRAAQGPDGRGAVEIYEGDTLVGVMTGTPVAPQPLRGARRAGHGSRTWAIAWGRLPADGDGLCVVFSGRLPPHRARPGELARLGDWGWVAVAAGRFGQVQVCCAGRRLRRTLRSRWEQ